MQIRELSPKDFIGNLPRFINENLRSIVNSITSFFDEDTNTLKSTYADISDSVKAQTIRANNIVLTLEDENTVSMSQILQSLENINQRLDALENGN